MPNNNNNLMLGRSEDTSGFIPSPRVQTHQTELGGVASEISDTNQVPPVLIVGGLDAGRACQPDTAIRGAHACLYPIMSFIRYTNRDD